MPSEQPKKLSNHAGPRIAYVIAAEDNPDSEITITVQCPYCHEHHQHTWPEDNQRPHYQAPCRNRNAQGINGAGYFAELPEQEHSP